MITVAIDAMGGDNGVNVTVPAAVDFLQKHEDANVFLVGKAEILEKKIEGLHPKIIKRIKIKNASQVVDMNEPPVSALRHKKDSSMRISVNLVKEGSAAAAVSAGNTGALMAISKFVLKMLPGIDRPAIAAFMPNVNGSSCMLDLGANVDCSADSLVQFAVMGSCLVKAENHKQYPSIGLLNVGEEETKGNDTVKKVAEILRNSGLNFFGNIEGSDIYKGTTDVIVCDGFAGNISLKTSEGLVKFLSTSLKKEFMKNIFTKFLGILALPVLKKFREKYDPRKYNGATLIGLKGIVVKSHGSTDKYGFGCALEKSYNEIKNRILEQISKDIITINR